MRRAVDLIRGQHVEEARRILRFSGLGSSRDLEKLLDSAIANAEQRPGVIADNLIVARAWVDTGPTLKRYRPRAYGRATRVRKRTSHVTVVVETMEPDDGGTD
jgi:large subunit ribosomal protein L22